MFTARFLLPISHWKKMPKLPGNVIIGNGLNNTENIQCVGVEVGISQTILVVYKLWDL